MSLRITLVLESHGGSTTGFVVPDDVVESLGAGGRPKVVVTAGAHTWRTSIARMGGRYLLGVSAENRGLAGLAAGDTVDLTIDVDEAPREVELPEDLEAALAADPARRARWDALSFTVRKEHARQLTEAKQAATRERRLAKILDQLA